MQVAISLQLQHQQFHRCKDVEALEQLNQVNQESFVQYENNY